MLGVSNWHLIQCWTTPRIRRLTSPKLLRYCEVPYLISREQEPTIQPGVEGICKNSAYLDCLLAADVQSTHGLDNSPTWNSSKSHGSYSIISALQLIIPIQPIFTPSHNPSIHPSTRSSPPTQPFLPSFTALRIAAFQTSNHSSSSTTTHLLPSSPLGPLA